MLDHVVGYHDGLEAALLAGSGSVSDLLVTLVKAKLVLSIYHALGGVLD